MFEPDRIEFVAFKEWQVVCDALESGEQTVLLRKGGIAEGKSGFQWQFGRFFLFPTHFHEQVNRVRPDRDGNPRVLKAPPEKGDKVEIRLWAEIEKVERLTDFAKVQALSGRHIWKEEIVRERFESGEEPALQVAHVRVRRLAEPWILENRKSFGGCRSWVGLPEEEWGGKPLPDPGSFLYK